MQELPTEKNDLYQILESWFEEDYGPLVKRQEHVYPHGILGYYTFCLDRSHSIVAIAQENNIQVIHNWHDCYALPIIKAIVKFIEKAKM